MKPTTDLCDELGEAAEVLELAFLDFGARRAFQGPAVTLRTYENNVLVRATLEEPGRGRVLVVDGGGSRRCALLGDRLATLGRDNGWQGIVVFGCVRDSAELAEIDFGVKAIGTSPRKSRKDENRGTRDAELRIGGTSVASGDHIYADMDGVVVVKKAG